MGRRARITVQRLGAGAGRVVSSPAGIDCGAVCSASFDAGTTVTLAASTDFTSSVSGWSLGACGSSCPVVATSNQSVTVTFACNFTYAVDAVNGNDSNIGSCAQSFKTISKS